MKAKLALKALVATVAVAYFAICALAFVLQKNLIYLPDVTAMEHCPTPIEKEGDIVSQGTMRGYLFMGSEEQAVVYYHGNGGRACNRIILLPELSSGGASVLFVEYDGYAGEGTPSKEAILQNVEDTIAYLESEGYSDVIVVGESIGNGPAAYHTSRAPVSRVVMITPYRELAEVAAEHYPFLPMRALMTENFRPAEWLSSHRGAVRLAVAGSDEVIPPEQGRALYEGLSVQDKMMIVVEGAGHNTIFGYPEFSSFLRESVAR